MFDIEQFHGQKWKMEERKSNLFKTLPGEI